MPKMYNIYCSQYFRVEIYKRKTSKGIEYGYQERYRYDRSGKFIPKSDIVWGYKKLKDLDKFLYKRYQDDSYIYQQYEMN